MDETSEEGREAPEKPGEPTGAGVNAPSLRVGAVSYTNALPLVAYLHLTCPQARIERMVPALLGERMHEGRLDVALLSSIELLRHPDYGFVPGLGICSDGPVRSVCLFTQRPVQEIRTVALDRNSLTSIILLKILFDRLWHRSPAWTWYTPPVKNGLAVADAAMSIGDSSLDPACADFEFIDLGVSWKELTGLPFVYALWVTRPNLDAASFAEPFAEAKNLGLQRVDELAESTARQYHSNPGMFRDYFTRCIQYELGEREQQGLDLYFQYARYYM